jgi:hypothetical protein
MPWFRQASHGDDGTPPTPISNVSVRVHRLDSGAQGCGGEPDLSTCGPLTQITVGFDASDDRTPLTSLALDLSIASGAPEGLLFQGGVAVHNYWGGESFVINYYDRGQRLDFEVSVTTVDLNGNRSDPVLVHILDEGATAGSGGCSLAGVETSHTSAILVTLVALAMFRRRGARGRRGPRARRA